MVVHRLRVEEGGGYLFRGHCCRVFVAVRWNHSLEVDCKSGGMWMNRLIMVSNKTRVERVIMSKLQ